MAGYIGTQAVSVNTTSATISDDLAVGDDLTVTDDATIGGTLGVTGVVTANAGVVVDELTIDADTITATDDFIIDAVGDITLDAAGTQIILKKAGTQFGEILTSSTPDHLYIKSSISDKDIIFSGIDGGAARSAVLTLDMSSGGRALFSQTQSFQGAVFKNTAHDSIIQIDATAANKNSIVHFGDGDDADVGKIDYDHNINDMIITANASECARFISEGGITFNGDTAAANALNDYEEGTWTPAISATSGSLTTVNSIVGTYIKVGTKLTVFFQFNVADVGNGSGSINVTDIPFTEDNSAIQFYTGIVRARSGNTVTVSSGISELDPDGSLYLYGNQVRTGEFHGQVTFKTT